MSQMFDPEPVTGEYECRESRAETTENTDQPGQTQTTSSADPCGGASKNGEGCSCDPPF